jgi:enterochelin esterase-like enzyme
MRSRRSGVATRAAPNHGLASGRRCSLFLALMMGIGSASCTSRPQRAYVAGEYNAFSMLSPARKMVYGTVYLPPGWVPEAQRDYPLLVFLGSRQRGYPDVAPEFYPSDSLNHWIATEAVPPMVIVEVEFATVLGEAEPWSSARNEAFLTSDSRRELRAVCRQRFGARGSASVTSMQGFSFGAAGALHYALAFPDSFASVVSDAFVGDDVLVDERSSALLHLADIRESGLRLRMSIGSMDEFVLQRGRQATYVMHDLLDSLDVPHEFEVVSGVGHDAGQLSRHERPDGPSSVGLLELQFHARAWAEARPATPPT